MVFDLKGDFFGKLNILTGNKKAKQSSAKVKKHVQV